MIRSVDLRSGCSTGVSRNVAGFRLKAVQRTVVLLLLFMASNCQAHAQSQPNDDGLEVTATADRTDVQIADPFQLTIQVTAPQDTQANFPEFPESLGPFDVLEVTDRFDMPNQLDSTSRMWTKELTLETIETGRLQIPSVEITVLRSGGSPRILRTEPVDMVVASVVENSADLTKFQDIAGLHDVQPPAGKSSAWVWWLVGSVAALAGVAGGVLLFTRTERHEKPVSWAIRELAALGDEDFLQSESILRTFIAERFGFPAESYPADAIVETLQKRGVAEECLAGVSELLETTERIKFGGLQNNASDATTLVASAQELIQQLDENQEID